MKYNIILSKEIAEIYNLSANYLETTVENVLQDALTNYIDICLKEKRLSIRESLICCKFLKSLH